MRLEKLTCRGRISFNGAAPMMERKTRTAVTWVSAAVSFNGAAPMMERKTTRRAIAQSESRRELQWGRSDDGAENET